MSTSQSRIRLRNPGQLLATSIGASVVFSTTPALKKIPGTMGTVPAIVLWWLLAIWIGWSTRAMIIAAAVMFVIGIPLVWYVSRQLGVHDDSRITWDEIVGYFAAALFIPEASGWALFGWLMAAFALFRYFDMVKPCPVSTCDRWKGAFWVMMDDAVGGALAGLMVWWFATSWQSALHFTYGYLIIGVFGGRAVFYWLLKAAGDEGLPKTVWQAIQNPISAW